MALGWAGWRAYQIQRDLRAAVNDATALQADIRSGNQPGIVVALARLQEHGDAADHRSHGLTWRLLTHLPFLGDDARGVQVVSQVVAGLGRDGLPPLTASADRLDQLLPQGGGIDLARLAALRAPVRRSHAAFEAAGRQLAAVDSSGFVGPLQQRYADLVDRVHTASGQLSSAQTALRILPGFLGQAGPRNYLLVFQSNAEVRATGGLPGSVALVHADHGRVTLGRQAPGYPIQPSPALAISSQERSVFGPQLGSFFVDANFTPDFPRAAQLMQQGWTATYGDKIDGVIAIDPVTLSYLLGPLGALQVGDVTLTEDNAAAELLNGEYLRITDPVAQDTFFRSVAAEVFNRIVGGGFPAQGLLSALSRGVSQHRLLVASFHRDEEKVLAPTPLSGRLIQDPKAAPQVGFYVNDATGGKMSYYLRYDVAVSATSCREGRQMLTGAASLTSLAPADAATSLPVYMTGGGAFGTAPGDQLDIVTIFGPVGGSLTDVLLNGKPLGLPDIERLGDRPVAIVDVETSPGETADLTWAMLTGHGQTGNVVVSATAGVDPTDKSSVASSAC